MVARIILVTFLHGNRTTCVNAKGKGFITQGQSTGEAGLANAVSSSCRETI